MLQCCNNSMNHWMYHSLKKYHSLKMGFTFPQKLIQWMWFLIILFLWSKVEKDSERFCRTAYQLTIEFIDANSYKNLFAVWRIKFKADSGLPQVGWSQYDVTTIKINNQFHLSQKNFEHVPKSISAANQKIWSVFVAQYVLKRII